MGSSIGSGRGGVEVRGGLERGRRRGNSCVMQQFADTNEGRVARAPAGTGGAGGGGDAGADALTRLVFDTGIQITRLSRREIRAHPEVSLSLSRLKTLSFLAGTPDASLSALAEHLLVGVPTASRLVDELVEQGLVDRRSDPDDRRRLLLRSTPAGAEALAAAAAPAHRRIEALLDTLGAAERAQVRAGFDVVHRLVQAAADDPDA